MSGLVIDNTTDLTFAHPCLLTPQARQTLAASTARVWMKSAIVEREAGDSAAQRRLLEEGLRRFPTYWKLWMMLGQVGVCRHRNCIQLYNKPVERGTQSTDAVSRKLKPRT